MSHKMPLCLYELIFGDNTKDNGEYLALMRALQPAVVC